MYSLITQKNLWNNLRIRTNLFWLLFPQIHRKGQNKYWRINNAMSDLCSLQRTYGDADSLTVLYSQLEDRLMYNRKRVLEIINDNYTDIMEINKL